jgi:hypothetical protein
VDADNPVSCDSIVNNALKKETYKINKITDIKYNGIFENTADYFYQVKVKSEDIDGNESKETFIQQSSNFDLAVASLKENVKYGEIVEFKLTDILEILK